MSLTAGDRYCYPETGVLKNRLNIRDAERLDEASNESASLAWVLFRQSPPDELDFAYLLDAHFFMFGRVFDLAGQLRDVPLSPAGANRDYCAPAEMEARLASAFRTLEDRNYLTGLAEWDFCAGLANAWAELDPAHLRDARLASWNGSPGNLADYLYERLLPPKSSPVNPGFVDAPAT